ncbi:MAG TPA: hypothetical protein VHW64_04300 [Nocardioides sp.]|uniref:hypothetical protein n=1 Tax=Nocardioides sp. TaxID=35761 RepID=UPI002E37AFA4|nr:hypothetical protein [Nocardioides sp.]HEX3929898.1 hypothetical protein [Nocardioides sp.]
MTRSRRTQGAAAVLATITAVALATTAQGDAHAATKSDTSAAPARTTVNLRLTGCDRCTVQLQHAVNHELTVWTSKERKVGPDHKVVFVVATRLTHGLSFVVRAPWEGDTGAVSNMVTRYPAQAVDSHVSRTVARHARRAEGCWAGTDVDEVFLGFHVARVAGRTLDGHKTKIPLAYATHTMSSWKPAVKTFKGTTGNQDAFYCSRPKTTKLTLTAANCDGCQIQVMNGALRPENTWEAKEQTMTHGQVTVRVPRDETRGISATVYAPWEGNTGYTTVVAWRYGGQKVGSNVDVATARASRHGSACWGGTTAKSLTVPLTIRKVRVQGNTGPTHGSVAFASVTQPWLRPMMRAYDGILGSQEVIACDR